MERLFDKKIEWVYDPCTFTMIMYDEYWELNGVRYNSELEYLLALHEHNQKVVDLPPG